MYVSMSGIDHNTELSVRESFSLSPEAVSELNVRILEACPELEGSIILSTCNRTEIYLSSRTAEIDPGKLLCENLDVPEKAELFISRQGDDAVRYLAQLCCGVHSQLWGESQIIAQVKGAASLSRERGCTDPFLETMFRVCISAGKEVRGSGLLRRDCTSSAHKALELTYAELGNLQGKSALVIGSGEMGQLSARLLQEAGCRVKMTLRSHHSGETVVPSGCSAVMYDERYGAMEGMDILFSATASRHCTVTLDRFGDLRKKPSVVVDLSVPRDVEPEISVLPGVRLFNIDHLGGEKRDTPGAAEDIIESHIRRLRAWQDAVGYLRSDCPRFPVFMDLVGKRVVIVGGGTVALRRAKSLMGFGAQLEIIAPELKESISGLGWMERPYKKGDLEGAVLALAATDSREVNSAVAAEAQALGIPVSVCDSREDSSFFFPALCFGDGVIAGVVGDGSDHKRTVRAAKAVRRSLEVFNEHQDN